MSGRTLSFLVILCATAAASAQHLTLLDLPYAYDALEPFFDVSVRQALP